MNQKRNTIIAIIFTIIVIGVFIFASVYSLNKTPTRADLINKQLRAQKASWVAKDYPQKIFDIPLVSDSYSEDYNLENKTFSVETEKIFFPEDTDLNLKPEITNKNKLTGLLFLETKISPEVNFKLNDKITLREYMTPGKEQKYCGACRAFATLSAMEGYINKKYNYVGKNKLDLSEQYLLSYSNFMGCGGTHPLYYLNLITLSEFDSKTQKLDNYLKNKIKTEINNATKKHEIQKLKTKTQLSFAVGEVPLGVPTEEQLKYLSYDSCEIIKLDKSQNSTSGMDISKIKNIFSSSEINSAFCPDGSDRDFLNSPVRYKYTIPEKKDKFIKYFVEDYFVIEKKDCKQKNSKTVDNIKAALKYTPVTTSISFYDSMKNYYQGVWEKTEVDKNKIPGSHAVVIVGWGVEETRNKEYWIIKNSFGDTWGGDGYFRVWIQDKDLNLECEHMQGFYGELITKSGKEINALLPAAKEEIRLAKELEKEKLKMQIEKLPQPITPAPTLPNVLDPLREYNIINIDYLEVENITDEKCVTINNCIYTKLKIFYGNNNTEENELT